jgi:hypothetical protein
VVVGLVVVAGGVVGAGKAVVSVGLFVAVPDLGGQGECSGVLGVRLGKLSGGVAGLAEAVQDRSFNGPVTDITADREGLLVVVDGLLVAAPLPMDEPEAVEREGFGGVVVDVVSGVLDVGVGGPGAWGNDSRQGSCGARCCQLGGVGVPTVGSGIRDDRSEVGPFDVQPALRGAGIGQRGVRMAEGERRSRWC